MKFEFKKNVVLMLLVSLISSKAVAGGPLIDTGSIFGAKELSKDFSGEFRVELERLLDYFFDVKLEPFLETINGDVKDGTLLLDGIAERRITQINDMLLEVVGFANKSTFHNADEFQEKVLENAFKGFSSLKKDIFSELNQLKEGIFTSLGCAGTNFKEGIPLIGDTAIEELFQRHPFVFEKNILPGHYKDLHGCFSESNIDVKQNPTDYEKMVIFTCAVEKKFPLGEMTATNIVAEYGELSRIATLTYCKYAGARRSVPIQELIFEKQVEILRKAAAWKKLTS